MNLNQLTNNWGKINRWDYLADSRWNYEDITYILDPQNIEKIKHSLLEILENKAVTEIAFVTRLWL